MSLQRIGMLLVLGAAVSAMACGAQNESTEQTKADNAPRPRPARPTRAHRTAAGAPATSAPREPAPTDQYASNEGRATSTTRRQETTASGAGRGSWDAPMESTSQQPTRTATVMRSVPAGQELEVVLLDDLSSAISKPGDSFRASVSQNVVSDGGVAIPWAACSVARSSRRYRSTRRSVVRAKLVLDFDRLELPSGETVPVNATFEEVGKSETKKDAATIAGATAGGAILGRILKDDDRKKGTLIGAVVGAATGTAIAAKTEGQEVQMVSGTAVTLKLTDSVNVRRASTPSLANRSPRSAGASSFLTPARSAVLAEGQSSATAAPLRHFSWPWPCRAAVRPAGARAHGGRRIEDAAQKLDGVGGGGSGCGRLGDRVGVGAGRRGPRPPVPGRRVLPRRRRRVLRGERGGLRFRSFGPRRRCLRGQLPAARDAAIRAGVEPRFL